MGSMKRAIYHLAAGEHRVLNEALRLSVMYFYVSNTIVNLM
jgi:hypothetical protein